MHDQNVRAVIKGVAYFLAHVPSMIRHGSKPSREILKDPSLLNSVLDHLWSFEKAVSYPPNQVFIGNLDPDDLLRIPTPWYKNLRSNGSRWGAFGEIMPEEEFYGIMKMCDEFQLMLMEEGFLKESATRLKEHPLIYPSDLKKLDKGVSLEQIKKSLDEGHAMPIYARGERYIRRKNGRNS